MFLIASAKDSLYLKRRARASPLTSASVSTRPLLFDCDFFHAALLIEYKHGVFV